MTNTVRLTPEAAERFPNLGQLTGIVVITEQAAERPSWTLVAWPGGITAWLPAKDLAPACAGSQGPGEGP
jgi:hypothetical protein